MLQFVREIPLQINIDKALSSGRGFVFFMAAGFSHAIDPFSGMSINLMRVDEWLAELKAELEAYPWTRSEKSLSAIYQEILKRSRTFLSQKAKAEGASLESLNFREERDFGFGCDSENEFMIFHTHFIESLKAFPQGLAKLTFLWSPGVHTKLDFSYEGFVLLKEISRHPGEELLSRLRDLKRITYPCGSTLLRVRLLTPLDGSFLDL